MTRKPNPDGKFSLHLGAERRAHIEDWIAQHRAAAIGAGFGDLTASLHTAVLILIDRGLRTSRESVDGL